MKILALSDVELPAVYSFRIRERFPDADLAISCGDLPYYYLEYVLSSLDSPLPTCTPHRRREPRSAPFSSEPPTSSSGHLEES